MTTATAHWPTADELDVVEQKAAQASNALDELQLTCYRVASDLDALDDGSRLPTFDELGRLSRLIACVEQDIEVMGGHLNNVREAHHAAAIRMASDAR